MEARSRSSSAPVLPVAFALQRSQSPTRHFTSPSSSSAFNFAVHRTLSPTRATLGLDRSTSQVRSAGRPISPKGGAAMKPIPCAPPRKTFKCEEVCHDEFACKDRRCGRRMGEKSPHCSYTPFQPPHAKESVFSAAAQQALPYDHGRRCLLKLASGCPRFQIQFWPVSPIFL